MPHLVQQAFRSATSGRPAPVYLDLPSNVLCDKVETDEHPILSPQRYRATMPPVANARLIDQAAEMLVKAELPLIHTGGGVLRGGAWAEMVELAEDRQTFWQGIAHGDVGNRFFAGRIC